LKKVTSKIKWSSPNCNFSWISIQYSN